MTTDSAKGAKPHQELHRHYGLRLNQRIFIRNSLSHTNPRVVPLASAMSSVYDVLLQLTLLLRCLKLDNKLTQARPCKTLPPVPGQELSLSSSSELLKHHPVPPLRVCLTFDIESERKRGIPCRRSERVKEQSLSSRSRVTQQSCD